MLASVVEHRLGAAVALLFLQGWRISEPISLVFTTPTGGLVLRRTVSKLVKQGAKTAGITTSLGTHAGRRSVVTSLFVEGGEALEDIARFVWHTKPSTTAGYVKRLGRRPETVARRAADILDASGQDAAWRNPGESDS